MRKCLGLIFAGILVQFCVAFAQGYRDYPNKYLWYEKTDGYYWGKKPQTTYEYWAAGAKGWDKDAFISSELGEGIITLLKNYILYRDEMHPDVLRYWKNLEKGLKKEIHDAQKPEAKWATYTPLSAYVPANKNRRYPVVIAMHGGADPIFIVESYNVAQIGAKEEFITVMPQTLTIEEYKRILNVMDVEGYPIDRSRVYGTGFSNGGFRPQLAAMMDPTLFAAIAVGGQNNVLYKNPFEAKKEYITDKEYQALADLSVPCLNYNGTMETVIRWPLYIDNLLDMGEGKISAFNAWRKFTHVVGEDLTVEKSKQLAASSPDIVKKIMGIDFAKTQIVKMDGTNYYIGDFFTKEGINTMRYVAIEGMNHWPTPSSAVLAWDFFKHFSRDFKTGKIIAK